MLASIWHRLKKLPPVASLRTRFIENTLLHMCGEISHREAAFLLGLVQGLEHPRPIVEIGTLFGFSTAVLALGKQKSQHLITVDNYSWNPYGLSADSHERVTRRRLRGLCSDGTVKVIRQAKSQFFETYNFGPPALVFLDADHSYEATREDILWAKSVNADVIAGHDYSPGRHDGVVKAVDEQGGVRQLCESLFVLA